MLRKIRQMLKSQEGFTLVELMIVVVILGILAGIGVQQYGQVQKRAQDSAHAANIRIIKGAGQMYLMFDGVSVEEEETETGDMLNDVIEAGYLEAMPKDPYGGDNKYGVKFVKKATDDPVYYEVVVLYGGKEMKEQEENNDENGGGGGGQE